ncbi:hypothetical protein SDJN03_28535, partial [Cucurbita argyrosperma subsp. sororia]
MAYVLKSWPELNLMQASTVENIIKRQHPEFQIVILLAGSPVTKDLKHGRVRLFVNILGIVVEIPREG